MFLQKNPHIRNNSLFRFTQDVGKFNEIFILFLEILILMKKVTLQEE